MKRTCKCKARLEKARDWCENCGRWYPDEWVEKYADHEGELGWRDDPQAPGYVEDCDDGWDDGLVSDGRQECE